tara:strand:+ start:655 stop:2532 length:1878 start_codon:yes stop_codon:yes gene_type:complete
MRCAAYATVAAACLSAQLLAACSASDAPPPMAEAEAARPKAPAGDPGDRQVFFGDLHLHTSLSLDAAASRTETLPEDAYRYAMGEPIHYLGRTIQRRAPLDFLAVTDHAEYLGTVRLAMRGELEVPGEGWAELLADRRPGATMFQLMSRAVAGIRGEDTPGLSNPALVNSAWNGVIAAAERYNQPGKFTAFVAFEYSPTIQAEGAAHLHRNVIFRGPDYPSMPFGATDSMKPEALWAYAEANRQRGIESLMIPHNSNLSSGLAFQYDDFYGNPMTRAYAANRLRNEPLVEITQNKGTSEALPKLSPEDEFAGFELLPEGDGPGASAPGSDAEIRGSFVRYGLQRGLELAETLGVNPFEYGFVGSSDFHSGASASEEDNFPGGLGMGDDHRDPRSVLQTNSPVIGAPNSMLSASGITGIWAEENTRPALFDALQRRETYATSGPRMRVRMFAGWGDSAAFEDRADWASRAYRWGVPMGGILAPRPTNGGAPTLLIQAAKDPLSGNLDRVQIVKLWREGGQSYEKIYDVLWSPQRQVVNGQLQPVGNTVNVAEASYTNTIGAPELFGSWTDPDFNPAQSALYYARVLEIPTPRWATYLAKQTGIPLKEGTPPWLQERAWTSPIFYRP